MSQNARILIIDDNVAEATLTRLTLQAGRIGCSIEHVTDGYTGIDRLKEAVRAGCPFHIVILDINMPTISGCETLEVIRDTKGIADTYVVILTSLQCKADCPRDLFLCHQKGADIYLRKEVSLDDFEAELTRLKTDYDERRKSQRPTTEARDI